MELDRPHHRTTSNNNELFICFTSRLSSSSMKISKSILSPGRSRDQSMPMSLPTSLSRRLRTNGSIKGGAGQASPMFPNTTNKKRGCGYENPEPSSPKVTCIGQVRVKTKKKAAAAKKQTRSLSRRRSSNGGGDRGEVSFRRIDDGFSLKCEDKVRFSQQINQEGRNQRWVHLPLTICEALKAFGNEFSCLFPCSSSCFSNSDREKVEKENGGGSCGAVFARWLVTLQDGENGKQREIELVVGEEDEEDHEVDDTMLMSRSTRRRHVLEDFEVISESFNGDKNIEQVEEKVEGRVSVCVPPKNALLLMRCRSDPVKMAALTNRSCESPPVLLEDEDLDAIKILNEEIIEEIQQINEEDEVVQEEIELVQATELLELAGEEEEEEEGQKGNLTEEESSSSLSSEKEEMEAIEIILLAIESALQEEINADIELNNKDEEETEDLEENDDTHLNDEETIEEEEEERKLSMEESSVLPDCLLLMMCEPKLSMEVSKETWVCSTDFVRCLPQKKKTKKEVKKEINLETNTKRVSFDLPLPPRPPPQLVVPPRSSCTLPISMASMIEQNLVNAVGYEPFVLTRCKSEPMRTAKAKLAAPESCYWTKRKLEPLRRAAYQVGATGVGF